MQARSNANSVYRIDKFIVPPRARQEFLAKVFETHDLLGAMEGCLQNLVLEQVSGTGQHNIVTVVEWADADALEKAKSALMNKRTQDNFDPQEMFARLGIEADPANYVPCATADPSSAS
jgi:quinol monooxygenase YgiN